MSEDSQLQLVVFVQAKGLKGIGFDLWTRSFYENDGMLWHGGSTEYNLLKHFARLRFRYRCSVRNRARYWYL